MFGNVFLTVHKKNNMLYALKAIDRKKILAYEIQDNIVLERKILLELDHVFIMKLVINIYLIVINVIMNF